MAATSRRRVSKPSSSASNGPLGKNGKRAGPSGGTSSSGQTASATPPEDLSTSGDPTPAPLPDHLQTSVELDPASIELDAAAPEQAGQGQLELKQEQLDELDLATSHDPARAQSVSRSPLDEKPIIGEEEEPENEQQEEKEQEPAKALAKRRPRRAAPLTAAPAARSASQLSTSSRSKSSGKSRGRGGGHARGRGSTRGAAARRAKAPARSAPSIYSEDEEELESEDVTRCPCGNNNGEVEDGLMIQCELCKVWQHGPCVGLFAETSCPDTYYCEQCRPDLHPMGESKPHPRPTQSRSRGSSEGKARSQTSGSRARSYASPVREDTASGMARSDHKRTQSQDRERAKSVLAGKMSPVSAKKEKSASYVPASYSTPTMPKRRSTLNSRLEEEQLALATAASLKDLGLEPEEPAVPEEDEEPDGDQQDEQEDQEENEEGEAESPAKTTSRRQLADRKAAAVRPSYAEDDNLDIDSFYPDPPPAKSGKGKKRKAVAPPDNQEGESVFAKPKHPNQYTYRPKPGPPASRPLPAPSAPRSPVRKTAESHTVVPAPRRPRDHHAHADGGIDRLSWHLPDHLAHLAHLLPSSAPKPIEVPVTRPIASTSKAAREAPGPDRAMEPPMRVKFPSKRSTLPELRKRAKAILDYLQRAQVEMAERSKRNSLLGLASSTSGSSSGESSNTSRVDSAPPQSMIMMDKLERELTAYQDHFWGDSKED
ncbi:uncharacterized protein L969DRAFT_87283 [Mixia osmundae IAM 14324]|uniref:Zinc finger PHD-type domain-containing protein n=1 Tax=Mixia osmundae (strain CBS 9802 / IAM 14324 / JCM 22182 / KY 12970) TaxID=764103 RepID=G7E3D6_MIXOS|nr:uncharacterized protein L969DRAFT_87283 [Mixia osmundae IAM 14324]KEI39332.1 hypothetical protein L969DRAFT_87283 [Mixia osmundae IAM 14324]GAA97346.1 hypothetical protein E5Q_04024 [Mixia osmundae IAM 14324]